MASERIDVLGLPVDDVDMSTAIERIAGFIASKSMHQVVTADASMVVTASMDSEFLAIAKAAAMVTSDGAGILWASRKLGLGIRNKCSGVDLAERIVSESVQRLALPHSRQLKCRLAIQGATLSVLEMATSMHQQEHPWLLRSLDVNLTSFW
jgi:N-acetylglucosaminyldiphosphoundecaprenol N-acetyl-beta-D-mannosaminyltransferase